MDTGTTDATGQVDTSAVTQGTDAATTGAGQGTDTLLGGDAQADGSQAAGAAPVDGEQPPAGEKGAPADGAQGDKPGDGQKQDDASKSAPAEYADFTAPDGITYDAAVMGDFKTLAKDLKLTQEQAQQVADLGAKLSQNTQAKQAEAVQAEIAKWANDSKTDKEFGGDALAENLAGAKLALEKFGSPELKTMLNESGLGNHPEVIRLLHRVNKAVSEDTVLRGQASKSEQSMAQRMYPGMNP
jgi:hypothetical protein